MKMKAELRIRRGSRLNKILAVVEGALLMLLFLAPGIGATQPYQILHQFTGSDGASPNPLLLSGGTLYGTTFSGGLSNQGTIFRLGTDGSGFAVLKSFTGGLDGANPWAGLVSSGTTLYGTTGSGGSGGGGTVFRINTDGTGFAVVHPFVYGISPYEPESGLVMSGSTLYGTTMGGGVGSPNFGSVFQVDVDGTNYRVLRSLGPNDGAGPRADLLLSEETLYGATICGSASRANGTVFRLNTDGSGFQVLKELDNIASGNGVYSPLVLSGTTLFGIACEAATYASVFKLNTDGSDFTVLLGVTNSWASGLTPSIAGPTLSGTTLYGVNSGEGPDYHPETDFGTVFQVKTDGSAYAVLKTFTGGSDGANPHSPVVVDNCMLYGATALGGLSNAGVIFGLELSPPGIVVPPLTQTAQKGSVAGFWVEITNMPTASYQWYFSGTNALDGATNAVLELTNIQPSQAGAYTVVVTNVCWAVTSDPALLSVIPAAERSTVPAVGLPGGSGTMLHLEFADSLAAAPTWSPVTNVTLSSGPQLCFDLSQPLPAQRFYRGWQATRPPPTLGLSLATEIPLTGARGSSVRIDYINQFGPTNAWVTLDTVVLTNTTQLYFDVTMFRQPNRLYRLVAGP